MSTSDGREGNSCNVGQHKEVISQPSQKQGKRKLEKDIFGSLRISVLKIMIDCPRLIRLFQCLLSGDLTLL